MPMYTLGMDMEYQLRKAVKASGVEQNKVADMAGLAPSQMSFFMNGHRSLSLASASKLATALGYELRKKRPRKVR